MIDLDLGPLADIVGGELADPADARRVVSDVTIDSRTAGEGALFVALPGEHVDGHDFVADAVARGAAGALVAAGRPLPDVPGLVVVDDPADALLGLGVWLRETVAPTVVAITGSSGKTTTKDLTAAAIGAGRRTVANPGSYNNELGVPLTCCRLEADTEVLVVEIGTRGLGHIARLAGPLAPDVAIVTSVGPSHLELLGDVDTVARAKSELVLALAPGGTAVLNADDERVAAMAAIAPGAVVTYGADPAADWRAEDVRTDALARPTFRVDRGADAVEVRVPLPGSHNIGNALAALAAADACGVPPAVAAAGLAEAVVSPWRMEVADTPDGVTVLNDAYNANPASMRAALDTVAAVSTGGRRWAVLGPMAELGADGPAAHAEVGAHAAAVGVDGLVVVGDTAAPLARAAAAAPAPPEVIAVADADAAVAALRQHVRSGDVVLVKASRSAGLERVAAALTAAAGTEPGGTGAGGRG